MGFPDEVFNQPVMDELRCSICLLVIYNPRCCRLGHLFCAECIHSWLHLNSSCPNCKSILTYTELGRSLLANALLAKLNLSCPFNHFAFNFEPKKFKKDSKNDQISILNNKITPKNVKNAHKSSKMSSKSIPNSQKRTKNDETQSEKGLNELKPIKKDAKRCEWEGLMSDFERHRKECPMRPLQCAENHIFPFCQKKSHFAVCSLLPSPKLSLDGSIPPPTFEERREETIQVEVLDERIMRDDLSEMENAVIYGLNVYSGADGWSDDWDDQIDEELLLDDDMYDDYCYSDEFL